MTARSIAPAASGHRTGRSLRRTGVAAFAAAVLASHAPAQSPPPLQFELVAPDQIRFAWSAANPDWVLEGSGNLFQFQRELQSPDLVGDTLILTLPREESSFFWRLRAQPTSGLPGGRGYLQDSLGPFGNWSPDGMIPILYSSAALETLKVTSFSPPDTSSALAIGSSVLSGAPTRNNDELSRKIIGLAAGGVPVDSLTAALLDAQNPQADRGWGAADGYSETLLDTALALRALGAAGLPTGVAIVGDTIPAGQSSAPFPFEVPAGSTSLLLAIHGTTGDLHFELTKPDQSTIPYDANPGNVPRSVNLGTPPAGSWTMTVTNTGGADLTYSAEVFFTTADGLVVSRLTSAATSLATSQNADGGWPIFSAGESHLLSTFEIITTLRNYGNGFDTLLPEGAAWLYDTRRNTDGGFSSEPDNSNILETSLAILAIRAAHSGHDLAAALDYLSSRQLRNGSWENDPYLTALATRALFEPPRPPVVASIPGQSVVDPDPFLAIALDDFVSDPDHSDAELTWSVTGNTQLSVAIVDRVATLTYPAGTALSESLTFTATDPDGLTDSTTATFEVSVTPPFDYSIARGGSVTDTRRFTTTPEVFDQLASYFYIVTGLPADVTFTPGSFLLFAPDTLEPQFTIAVGASAPLGLHTFQVEYGVRDAALNDLAPLFDNVFDFTIEITP